MNLSELSKTVAAYNMGNLFGPRYRDTVSGTKEGDVSWTSTDRMLLVRINQEVFNNQGDVLPYSESDPNLFVLYIEIKKIK